MQGSKKKEDLGLLAMIDTEEKQLQCISDLWAIIKAQPKFKDLKEPVLSLDMEPLQVIQSLLRRLSPLAKGNEWSIDTYKEGKKLRYRFIVVDPFNHNQVRGREAFLPLDFLPGLLKRDKILHDLIIEIVALTSRCNKIPLWDEDGL